MQQTSDGDHCSYFEEPKYLTAIHLVLDIESKKES